MLPKSPAAHVYQTTVYEKQTKPGCLIAVQGERVVTSFTMVGQDTLAAVHQACNR